MPKSTIPPEVRAAAIADLQAGEQPAVVAERYGLPGDTVRKWKQRLVTADVTSSVPSSVTPPARPVVIRPQVEQAQLDLAALVMRNLEAKLLATQRIAEYAATNTAWLEKQTAADVGQLFEQIDRSALAILDRMAGAHRPAAADGDDAEAADPGAA